ncbi:hypothetical protein GCM10027343_22140 [Noviherbaspirillum agri]
MDIKHLVEPQSQGTWIVATFIVALLALVVAFASLKRTNSVLVGTQAEVMVLNNKIEQMKSAGAQAPVAAAPAAASSDAPAVK